MISNLKNAKVRLAEALRNEGAPWEYIDAALKGRYDDIESKSATPITDLVHDCTKLGLKGLAVRIMEGEFDAEAWEWIEAQRGTRG